MRDKILSGVIGLIFGIIIGILTIRKKKYHGPDSSDIKHNLYNDGHSCYKLKPSVRMCPLMPKIFKR